jgi:ligand-binding SRPBCC domain-containing protein
MGGLCHCAQLHDLEIEPVSVHETAGNQAAAIRLGRKDRCFTVETRLFLPRPLEMVFPFFADAGNIETITPPWLRFEILTPRPIAMRAGALIDYRLRLRGIPLRWRSEITAWEPPHRFVDEQRRGPYRTWIHEHTFASCAGGCEARDFVRYAPPGGWVGNFLFVRRDVRKIFEYRVGRLRQLFG